MTGPHASLESILITDELRRRPYRGPNYEAENLALSALMSTMASSPAKVLNVLAETALRLCRAQSAGISIAEAAGGQPIFRWHAVAGAWSKYLGGTMPRDVSPCATVLEHNCALLMSRPQLHYPFPDVDPPVSEVLLVPFRLNDEPAGTIWVICHDDVSRFDREDLRLMTSLAAFAGAAYQCLKPHLSSGSPRPTDRESQALQDDRSEGARGGSSGSP